MSTIARLGRGLTLALALCCAAPEPATAQDDLGAVPAEGGGTGEGKPLWGYLAVGAGCIAIMFVICLSARR